MKNLILFALAALSISKAEAQVTISPVGGLNVSNYSVSGYNAKQQKMRFGPCIGALVDFPSKSKLSLQSGLMYKLNGCMMGNSSEFIRYRISTLDIPVKMTYSFHTNKGSRYFIGAGFYLGVNVAASVHFVGYRTDPHGTNMVDEVNKVKIGGALGMRRMDGGLGTNIGYSAAKGLLICLHGQYGFVQQEGVFGNRRNYNFGIVGGYSFKLKKHKAHSDKPAEAKQ